jgi:hypothetical protein
MEREARRVDARAGRSEHVETFARRPHTRRAQPVFDDRPVGRIARRSIGRFRCVRCLVPAAEARRLISIWSGRWRRPTISARSNLTFMSSVPAPSTAFRAGGDALPALCIEPGAACARRRRPARSHPVTKSASARARDCSAVRRLHGILRRNLLARASRSSVRRQGAGLHQRGTSSDSSFEGVPPQAQRAFTANAALRAPAARFSRASSSHVANS